MITAGLVPIQRLGGVTIEFEGGGVKRLAPFFFFFFFFLFFFCFFTLYLFFFPRVAQTSLLCETYPRKYSNIS